MFDLPITPEPQASADIPNFPAGKGLRRVKYSKDRDEANVFYWVLKQVGSLYKITKKVKFEMSIVEEEVGTGKASPEVTIDKISTHFSSYVKNRNNNAVSVAQKFSSSSSFSSSGSRKRPRSFLHPNQELEEFSSPPQKCRVCDADAIEYCEQE